jgi:hypothetical protein
MGINKNNNNNNAKHKIQDNPNRSGLKKGGK